MERLSRNFQLFSSFRNFQAIFAPSNSYFTEYSRWVLLSFVKIVVFSEDHHMIQDRNGPIINLDASVRSASRIFLFHQRKCVFLFFFFSSKSWDCISNYASVDIYIFKVLFLFSSSHDSLRCSRHTHSSKPFVQSLYIEGLERLGRRLIYESVNIYSLLVSRLQGYPSIEHLYLADSSLARVGSQKHLSIYDFVLRNFVFF